MPRREPPDWGSGGKVVKVDRVEWIVVPEPSTAAAALAGGEVDWWENPSPDLARVLAANPDLVVENTDPLGSMGLLRFNQLQPPFNNVKMRQAVLGVTDQAEFLTALAGDPKDWNNCASFFTCGTPMANDAGAAALTGKRDFDAARRLIAEAGYNGEKIVILDAVDLLTNHIHALVAAELFKSSVSTSSSQPATGAPWSRAGHQKSRSPKAAGMSSAPTSRVPRCLTLGSIRRSLPMATRPGSGGQTTTKSKRYEKSGFGPATARLAKRSPPRFRNAPLKLCPISRLDNTRRKPPIAKT